MQSSRFFYRRHLSAIGIEKEKVMVISAAEQTKLKVSMDGSEKEESKQARKEGRKEVVGLITD